MSNSAREDFTQPTAFEAPPEKTPAAVLALDSVSARRKAALDLDAAAVGDHPPLLAATASAWPAGEPAIGQYAEEEVQSPSGVPGQLGSRVERAALGGANLVLVVLFVVLCGRLGYFDFLASWRTAVTAALRLPVVHKTSAQATAALPQREALY